jgi:hypothetical protein
MSWLQCFDQSYSNVASYSSAASLANGLVPLAFLSPKIIEAIASGTARAGLTVSRLTQTQLCLLRRAPCEPVSVRNRAGFYSATPPQNAAVPWPTIAPPRTLVERFFDLLTGKQIRRGVHRSTDELEAAIRTYVDATNAEPKAVPLDKVRR